MDKVFIDCGGHVGESITRFKKSPRYSDDYKIYSFEPLPNSADKYRDMKGISFAEKAVWTEDGEMEFFTDVKQNTWGSTLIKEKDTSVLDKENPIVVETFDFSHWMGSVFHEDDFIIVKMDIEGAEYPVLRKMIDDGTINLVNEMYIEWHYDRIGMAKKEHDDLEKELGKYVIIHPEMDRVL